MYINVYAQLYYYYILQVKDEDDDDDATHISWQGDVAMDPTIIQCSWLPLVHTSYFNYNKSQNYALYYMLFNTNEKK